MRQAGHADAAEAKPSALPPPVREALDEADAAGKHLLLEFRAEWCGACRTMERTTFADADVVRVLADGFVVLPVDTDEHPDIARQFGVIGLPTLLILDGRGRITFRHTGLIAAQPLRVVLTALADQISQ